MIERLRAAIVAPALLALATGLAACSPVGILNALSPKGGVSISHGVAYGEGPRRALDIYAPAVRKPGRPVVVFLYGGNWDSGARAEYAFVGAALARRGYVTAIPDYRLYPQVRYPAFLEDCAAAVRWARDHAAEYGGDPQRIVLMGHSAGAYNAAMLAIDRRWLATVRMDPRQDIKAVVGLAGPYDFLPLTQPRFKAIFGPEEQRPQTQPVNHVDGRSPPIWLATDQGDKAVNPRNTARLAARIRQAGGAVEERTYARLNHALMVGVLAAPLHFLSPVFRDATAFIDARAGRP